MECNRVHLLKYSYFPVRSLKKPGNLHGCQHGHTRAFWTPISFSVFCLLSGLQPCQSSWWAVSHLHQKLSAAACFTSSPSRNYIKYYGTTLQQNGDSNYNKNNAARRGKKRRPDFRGRDVNTEHRPQSSWLTTLVKKTRANSKPTPTTGTASILAFGG